MLVRSTPAARALQLEVLRIEARASLLAQLGQTGDQACTNYALACGSATTRPPSCQGPVTHIPSPLHSSLIDCVTRLLSRSLAASEGWQSVAGVNVTSLRRLSSCGLQWRQQLRKHQLQQ